MQFRESLAVKHQSRWKSLRNRINQIQSRVRPRIQQWMLKEWSKFRQRNPFRWRMPQRSLLYIGIAIASLLLTCGAVPPATAQLPIQPTLQQISLGGLGGNGGGSSLEPVAQGITLDGEEIFRVTAPQAAIKRRVERVSNNLDQIKQNYLQQDDPDLDIEIRNREDEDQLPVIYVNGMYLLTVTQQDAQLQGTSARGLAIELEQTLSQQLRQAWSLRQPEARKRQIISTISIAIAAAIIVYGLYYWQNHLWRPHFRWFTSDAESEEMRQEQREHFDEVQQRILQLLQVVVIIGASVWILGFFPSTRAIQENVLSALSVPLLAILVVVVAYIGARLTFIVINRFTASLTLTTRGSRRAELRVSTISSVLKNIAVFTWLIVGLIVALALSGISLGVLLASASLLSVAFTLVFKDVLNGAVNGFFIILEDQYAIGDIVVLEDNHGLAGVVENFNLRVTQLRDTAGRLISVPTSEIGAVANLTSRWSRIDLKIPISYYSDLNHALEVVHQVAQAMREDEEWQSLFLEDPNLLGVDEFGKHGVILRLWIKTQPMKQWDVAREYRRRLKLAFDEENITIPIPQQDTWLHTMDERPIQLQGQMETASSQAHQEHSENGSPQRDRVKTGSATSPNADDVTNDGGEGEGDR